MSQEPERGSSDIDDDSTAAASDPDVKEPHRTGDAQAEQNQEEDPPA